MKIENVQWTLGVIELHDFWHWISENKKQRKYKYAYPEGVKKIKEIPNIEILDKT